MAVVNQQTNHIMQGKLKPNVSVHTTKLTGQTLLITIKSLTLFWYYSKSQRTSRSWHIARTLSLISPFTPSTRLPHLDLSSRPWWPDQARSSLSNSQIRPSSSTANRMWALRTEIRPRSSTWMAWLPRQQPTSSLPQSLRQLSHQLLQSSSIR